MSQSSPEPTPPEQSLDPQAVIQDLTAVRQEIMAAKEEGKDIAQGEELFKGAEPLLRTMDLVGCKAVIDQIRVIIANAPAGGAALPPPAPGPVR